MDINATLKSTVVRDGKRQQEFSDSEGHVQHREVEEGARGGAARWTTGPAPSHWVFDHVLTHTLTNTEQEGYPKRDQALKSSSTFGTSVLPTLIRHLRRADSGSATTTAELLTTSDAVVAYTDSGVRIKVANLDNLVPSAEDFARFKEPKIYGVDAFTVLKGLVRMKKNILLTGPSGTGKTELIRMFAHLMGWPFLNLQGTGSIDAESVWGSMQVDEEGTYVQLSELATAILLKVPFASNFDELNMAPQEMLSQWFPLLGSTRSVYSTLGGGFRLMVDPMVDHLFSASFNPGYEGTFAENLALIRRFNLDVPFGLQQDVVAHMLHDDPEMISLVDHLHHGFTKANPDLKQFPSPPYFVDFMEFYKEFGWDLAAGNLVQKFKRDADKQVVFDTLDKRRENLEASLSGTKKVAAKKVTEAETITTDTLDEMFPL